MSDGTEAVLVSLAADAGEIELTGDGPRANLGLATTQQLLDEITTRIRIDYYSGGGGLDYTTVGGRPGGYGVGPV